MDFLEKLFEGKESMSLEELKAAIEAQGIKLADLSEGKYVSKQKYEDDLSKKDSQITDLTATISTRDTDLEDLKKQLKDAGTDAEKLAELNTKFDGLQTKYDNDTKELQDKLSKQMYEFAVRDFASTKKFSSNAAKRDFINSMIAKQLQMENDKILGADDFVTAYTQENEDAFVVESGKDPEQGSGKPAFTNPTGGKTPPASEDGFMFNFTGVRAPESK